MLGAAPRCWLLLVAAMASLVVMASLVSAASCPMGGSGAGSMPALHPRVLTNEPQSLRAAVAPADAKAYAQLVNDLDWEALKKDIKTTLTTSVDFWPHDPDIGTATYGPFMIRHAWHCAGSYRISDGHGGCDGARQRFLPELSWQDNANLDKAKRILWPLKQKYGPGLSWSDLIIFTGTVAIESMGGPTLGFCAGRLDDADGSDSLLLGPTEQQQADAYCAVDGNCTLPLGATTLGLIYVNPEGPRGEPIPEESRHQVRDTFGRMAMNDEETIALIGGGHAFGKSHGACDKGPGPDPKTDPLNPWPGECGTGKGADAWTSGFEGPWTTSPTTWGNSYFGLLLGQNWEVKMGPGGHRQWHVADAVLPDPLAKIMMLTSDISIRHDADYTRIANHYLANLTAFEDAFKHAWYKLVTRDMGPVTRCLGPLTAPAQPFQNPLPPAPTGADISAVKSAIKSAMTTANTNLPADGTADAPSYAGVFVQLAFQCATPFRRTDYTGGCNGADIRFPPQSQWAVNVAMDKVLAILQPVKAKFDATLSWSDLIVLAGQVALEEGGASLSFCGGRSDAVDGTASQYLNPPLNGSATIRQLQQRRLLSGLSAREFVVLNGRLRSALQQERLGFKGTWSTNPTKLSNEYFVTLLNEQWETFTSSGAAQYKAVGKELYMTPADLALRANPEWLPIAQQYAANNTLFMIDFAAAWTKLVTIDRFDGPLGNVCASSSSSDSSSGVSWSSWYVVAAISVAGTALVAIVLWQCMCKSAAGRDDTRPLLPPHRA